MDIFIAIMAFMNGAVLASCFFLAFYRTPTERKSEAAKAQKAKEAAELERQWENFVNYNGTASGQRRLSDD